jgi:hypothetical protein
MNAPASSIAGATRAGIKPSRFSTTCARCRVDATSSFRRAVSPVRGRLALPVVMHPTSSYAMIPRGANGAHTGIPAGDCLRDQINETTAASTGQFSRRCASDAALPTCYR